MKTRLKNTLKLYEWEVQAEIASWLGKTYPDVLFTASVGGVRLGWKLAKQMKAMGYLRGTPDLLVFAPRNKSQAIDEGDGGGKNSFYSELCYAGLFGEIKRNEKCKPTNDQLVVNAQLNALGYLAQFWYGFNDAIQKIKEYLG